MEHRPKHKEINLIFQASISIPQLFQHIPVLLTEKHILTNNLGNHVSFHPKTTTTTTTTTTPSPSDRLTLQSRKLQDLHWISSPQNPPKNPMSYVQPETYRYALLDSIGKVERGTPLGTNISRFKGTFESMIFPTSRLVGPM